MYLLLVVLVVVICVLLGAIVLIQNPKGGGLTSNFSSQSQLMGVQKTGDFLEKGTWVLAIALMVLSLAINVTLKGGTATTTGTSPDKAKTYDKVNKPQPTAQPQQGVTLPAAPAATGKK
ncbi:MAG: preprotein translocase subunit SecG [Sphingobacteriales bacterium]